jgi:hypothetical protein
MPNRPSWIKFDVEGLTPGVASLKDNRLGGDWSIACGSSKFPLSRNTGIEDGF